jgi:hypothetical protein
MGRQQSLGQRMGPLHEVCSQKGTMADFSRGLISVLSAKGSTGYSSQVNVH